MVSIPIICYRSATGHFLWLVWSPGIVYHWTFVQHLLFSFSHFADQLFRRVRAANIVGHPCSDSSHATAPCKSSFYYYDYYYVNTWTSTHLQSNKPGRWTSWHEQATHLCIALCFSKFPILTNWRPQSAHMYLFSSDASDVSTDGGGSCVLMCLRRLMDRGVVNSHTEHAYLPREKQNMTCFALISVSYVGGVAQCLWRRSLAGGLSLTYDWHTVGGWPLYG